MRVVTCPVCGSTVNAQVHHCPECGADHRLPVEDAAADLRARGIALPGEEPERSPLQLRSTRVVTCPVCGSNVNAQLHHCRQCGADHRLPVEDAAADLRARGIPLPGEEPERSPLQLRSTRVVTCPVCGSAVNAQVHHCPECGADHRLPVEDAAADLRARGIPLPEKEPERSPPQGRPLRVVTCPVCGSTVNAQLHHCHQCGADHRLPVEDAAADLRARGIPLPEEGPEGSPLSAAASMSTAGVMTAAAIGGAVAGFLLVYAAVNVGVWVLLGWPEDAIIWTFMSAWALAVVLALVGIPLLAMRRRLLLAGRCFIASALLAMAAAVHVGVYLDGDEAIVYGASAVASLPLLFAGIFTIRRAPQVAAAALQQGAGDPDRTAARRGVIALALAGLVLTSELLYAVWLYIPFFDERLGIASDVVRLLLFWSGGVTLAAIGVTLLSASRWPRSAASFLLASCLVGVIGVAVYAGNHQPQEYEGWRRVTDESSSALGFLVAWGLAALPLLLTGLTVMSRPAAFRRSQEASS